MLGNCFTWTELQLGLHTACTYQPEVLTQSAGNTAMEVINTTSWLQGHARKLRHAFKFSRSKRRMQQGWRHPMISANYIS